LEKKDILLSLRSDEQPWLTSIHVTQEEALKLLNLSKFSKTVVDLPSVGGYAKLNGFLLEIYFQDRKHQNIISLPIADAHVVIEAAIDTATEIRRSEAAHSRIWDWINERHDGTCVLTLAKGEQISALLLNNDDEYLAIQFSDGSTAIAQVSNADEIPSSNSRIIIMANDRSELFVSKI
jgi:hypothetical protein